MARIAIGGFMHESNSFVAGSSDFEQFSGDLSDRPPLSRGPALIENLSGVASCSAGFIERIGGRHTLVPTVWASTLAGPPVSERAYERIAGELVGRLSEALPVDAVYLDLHGAMVAEHAEDGEGELLRRVRAAVGPDIPIAISLDYHCNFTTAMARFADSVCAYRTYPHVDQVETGQRAADALEVLLERGRTPARALRKLPFLLPLNFQCTLVDPTASIIEHATDAEGNDVLSVAYLAGFPPSDLFECGPALVVHGYDPRAVESAADALALDIARREPDFAEPLYSPDESVAEAMRIAASASKPVVIADTQDNPGAGGTGDTTGMLAALVRNGAEGAVLAALCDAEAAGQAHAAGIGASLDLDLGGRSEIAGDTPFRGRFTVKALGDGRYLASAPGAEGRAIDTGPAALLNIDGVDVVVTSRRLQARERGCLAHLGVDATRCKIIVLKSTCHFRADFQPITEQVLIAIAPGGHIADPARYPYQRLRPGVRLSPLGPASPNGVGPSQPIEIKGK